MKVMIQYTQTGMYKDEAWESPALHIKGQLHAVSPSYAVQLIQRNQACLYTDENNNLVISS
ncbi:hypothetical protein H8F06_11000 [Vibrio fluvialis]|uniref:hypothetical protein n=1 Tax=Vibrio fluvialis TaxID=676 RepID=UPI00192B79D3|nr:hypothetical protein [Vibrio fluvialis]MBL4295838.1 hypothetical protein [Vibrio fluvialis]